jgi:hypothetical protein
MPFKTWRNTVFGFFSAYEKQAFEHFYEEIKNFKELEVRFCEIVALIKKSSFLSPICPFLDENPNKMLFLCLEAYNFCLYGESLKGYNFSRN